MNFEISYNLVYLKEVFKYVLLPVSILILIVLAILFIYSRKEKDHESEQYIYIINLWTYLVCIVLSASLFAVVLSFAISFYHSVTEHGISHPIITIIYLTPLVPLAFLLSTSMRVTEIFVNHKRYKNQKNNETPTNNEAIGGNNSFSNMEDNLNTVNQNDVLIAVPPLLENENTNYDINKNTESNFEDKVEELDDNFNKNEELVESLESETEVIDNSEENIEELEPTESNINEVTSSLASDTPVMDEFNTDEVLDVDSFDKLENSNNEVNLGNELNSEESKDEVLSTITDDNSEILSEQKEENNNSEEENKTFNEAETNKDKYELKQKNLNNIESENTDDLEVL